MQPGNQKSARLIRFKPIFILLVFLGAAISRLFEEIQKIKDDHCQFRDAVFIAGYTEL